MLNEFIEYLNNQIGQPYLWGGQHTKLTPDNYVAVITKKEKNATNRANAIKYCEAKFDEGYTVLYAYDCSGLGMYWIADLHHIYSDMTADSMMHKCESISLTEPPKKGWWVFRVSNGRATHIGYMVDNEHVVQAEGRRFGVTYKNFRAKDWSQWGIPKCFYDEIVNPPEPGPQPEPPEPDPPELKWYVEVIAKSVRVRKGDGTFSKTVFIAHNANWYRKQGIQHGNDLLPYVGPAPSGWYQINSDRGDGYITNKAKYTRLVEL